MDNKEIKRKVEEGMIHVLVIVEIGGSPKEHVKKTLNLVLENMEKEENMTILDKKVYRPKKEGELFHAFAELQVLFEGTSTMLSFCVDYAPSSLEIIDPPHINLDARHASGLFNDILAAIHKTAAQLRDVGAQNQILNNNSRNLLRNLIYFSLREKEKKLEDLGKSVIIPPEQLEPFLKHMVDEGKLKKDGETYKLP